MCGSLPRSRSGFFLRAGGGELGDSCSISLPLLFVRTFAFRFVSLAPPASPSIRSGIGSECFVDVAVQCRFRPIHCSLSFGGSCPAAGVVVNFLPCSVQIERLGYLECRTVRFFGGWTSPLTDRGGFDFFPECLQLDALVVIIPQSSVSSPRVWARGVGEIGLDWDRVRSSEDDLSPGRIRCVRAVSVASLAPVNPVGVIPAPESGPIGSMSLTPEGVVPVVCRLRNLCGSSAISASCCTISATSTTPSRARILATSSGPLREVDEALRPGVYALVDSCSEQDRQYLHTVFGEGPSRNYLATLKQELDLNFKYEGKV
ncbi:hypothetical protein F2Q68_00029198 [Brassica cretica]|uniref:Nucleolar 27S pre-rRNA processing Urb2/Npa2 C-terminal domain-containing protein n=1 Tax=Brassica cretica TaxID=69181 RepID=A0A8S9GF28_BRACR|nr:hypothetical protein F2Q68_00029198 [Brassica cretica]